MRTMMRAPSGGSWSDAQYSSIMMITHKMARIANGNPDHEDHWLDIAGYATLQSGLLLKQLQAEETASVDAQLDELQSAICSPKAEAAAE